MELDAGTISAHVLPRRGPFMKKVYPFALLLIATVAGTYGLAHAQSASASNAYPILSAGFDDPNATNDDPETPGKSWGVEILSSGDLILTSSKMHKPVVIQKLSASDLSDLKAKIDSLPKDTSLVTCDGGASEFFGSSMDHLPDGVSSYHAVTSSLTEIQIDMTNNDNHYCKKDAVSASLNKYMSSMVAIALVNMPIIPISDSGSSVNASAVVDSKSAGSVGIAGSNEAAHAQVSQAK
jgi:hypothetical protein